MQGENAASGRQIGDDSPQANRSAQNATTARCYNNSIVSDRPDSVSHQIVIDLDPTVFDVATQRAPARPRIRNRLANGAFGQHLREFELTGCRNSGTSDRELDSQKAIGRNCRFGS